MLNKLCIGLGKKSLFQIYKPLTRVNVGQFSSSKHQKQNKSNQTLKNSPQTNSSLKSPTIIQTQNPNKKSKNSPAEQPKQAKGVLTEQQRKQLALQQKLQAAYTQLQCFSTDSYETVMQHYKRTKAKLNDRKLYIPNKPELLAQLDNNLELIKQHHKIWRSPSTSPERRLTDTKAEIIEWELEQAKKKYYLSLLDNQKVLIGIAGGIVILIAWIEYYNFVREPQDQSKKAPKMFL